MNRDFKLLVFDWDGTLMDSEARIVACIRAASDGPVEFLPRAATRGKNKQPECQGTGITPSLFPGDAAHG